MNRNMSQNGERHRNPSELLLDGDTIRERKNLAELENKWVQWIRSISWRHWMVGTFAPTPSLYVSWREESRASSRMIDTRDGDVDLPRIGGRLSACVFSLLPRAFGVRSFRCAGGAGE